MQLCLALVYQTWLEQSTVLAALSANSASDASPGTAIAVLILVLGGAYIAALAAAILIDAAGGLSRCAAMLCACGGARQLLRREGRALDVLRQREADILLRVCALEATLDLQRRGGRGHAGDLAAWQGQPVFAYGFEDLTAAEWSLLEALAGRAEVTVSLPYEPGRVAFASLERTAADLQRLAGPEHIQELPPRYAEWSPPALAWLWRSGGRASPPRSAEVAFSAEDTSRREVMLVFGGMPAAMIAASSVASPEFGTPASPTSVTATAGRPHSARREATPARSAFWLRSRTTMRCGSGVPVTVVGRPTTDCHCRGVSPFDR